MNEPRRVPFVRGFFWITEGFQLVFQSPIGWMKVITLWFGFIVLCSLLMGVGPILFSLLLPILFAGLMLGCRTVAAGGSMMSAHLFAGFKNKPSRLITLGGVNVLGEVILTAILMIWGGQHMLELQALSANGAGNIEQLQVLVSDMTPMLITILIIQTVLLMLGWFAPALLLFTDMTTGQALTLSGKACVMNTLPFMAYSLGMSSLLSLLIFTGFAVPWLGVPLLMSVAPTIIAGVYVSYTDIFCPVIDLDCAHFTRVEQD